MYNFDDSIKMYMISRQSRERDYANEMKAITMQRDVVSSHPLKISLVVSVSVNQILSNSFKFNPSYFWKSQVYIVPVAPRLSSFADLIKTVMALRDYSSICIWRRAEWAYKSIKCTLTYRKARLESLQNAQRRQIVHQKYAHINFENCADKQFFRLGTHTKNNKKMAFYLHAISFGLGIYTIIHFHIYLYTV